MENHAACYASGGAGVTALALISSVTVTLPAVTGASSGDVVAAAPQDWILAIVIGLMIAIAVAISRMRPLFAIAMSLSVYSLLCAIAFVLMDAPDVGFTEAAVGAGVSTILLLAALLLVPRTVRERVKSFRPVPAIAAGAVAALLLWAAPDVPFYGDASSAPNVTLGRAYAERTVRETGKPNAVTAVLASYRGFDTLGETAVIFTAGVAVLALIGVGDRAILTGRRRRRADNAGGGSAP
jgi:multicomponent Na+:H+ antiporter subunit B